MFKALAGLITRYWAVVLGAWTAALVVLFLIAPSIKSVRSNDDSTFLPDYAPSRIAAKAIRANFDKPPPMSVAAIIMRRESGLTGSPPAATQPNPEAGSDWDFITRLTGTLAEEARGRNWSLLSPADLRHVFFRPNLLSPDGQAAVIKVDLPDGFVSHTAIEAVTWIEQAAARAGPPAGLDLAISGSASYGRDYFAATEVSLTRATWVTLVAVLLMLLLTYRAPLATAIALATVSLAVIVAVSIVAIGGAHGWSVSVIVELFTIAIGYGAGVDFSLFFLSRYREELANSVVIDGRIEPRRAVIRAMVGTGPAIMASAGTVAVSLGLMYFAEFRVFRTAGPAVAISVIVSCLTSLTLAPALAGLFGPKLFWPQRVVSPPGPAAKSNGFWARLATMTAGRPRRTLIFGLLLLVPLAGYGWMQHVVYDTLADLPKNNQSVRGAGIFREHFPIGEMSPVDVVVQLDRSISEDDWIEVAAAVDRKLTGLDAVQHLRSLVHPLGTNSPITFSSKLARNISSQFASEAEPRYLGRDRQAALFEVASKWPPYSNEALDSLAALSVAVRQAAGEVPAAAAGKPRVHLAGDTPLMVDLKDITARDFRLVGGLAVAAIILIVTLLVRDLPVAVFVMLATIMTYGAALGVTSWLFNLMFETRGPDWKVEFFLFIILVAVGQDYNLFILTRIMEERLCQPLAVAARLAIESTGSIISYCGLIMAATLGSLATSPLRLLQELGVAFVIGLLLDTFLVRPLMVPAFVVVFKRINRQPAEASPPTGP